MFHMPPELFFPEEGRAFFEHGAPTTDPEILKLGIPILGICYGYQWLSQQLGGEVKEGKVKEYGQTEITVDSSSLLFHCLPEQLAVWMSHGDEVTKLPEGFVATAKSSDCKHAAMENKEKKIFGVQFHPEVTHSKRGMDILKNFIEGCSAGTWTMEDYLSSISAEIKAHVKEDKKVFILVSGGVDSTVAFTLLDKVLGKDRVYGLLINNGLMRSNEVEVTNKALRALGLDNLHVENASDIFVERLKGIYEPETKRKIIGQTFLDVKDKVALQLNLASEEWILGQGTIYPDTIETGGTKHASVIKTHHNRIDVITEMIKKGLVIEPLKDLYKDEVRALGALLGLPSDLLNRHPFPGPGLGVRILCCEHENPLATSEQLEKQIVQEAPQNGNEKFTPRVLPIKSVGVQGDNRTYRHPVAFFMEKTTNTWSEDFWHFLLKIPNRIGELNRVVICLSHTNQNLPEKFTVTPSFITKERIEIIQKVDAIVDDVMRKRDLYNKIWQFPVALIPIGHSTNGQSVVLRPVDSKEAMTATAYHIPPEILQEMSERITKEVKEVHYVFFDTTSKPPGTIEWE
eukprot:TRINITY_DN1226_c0_g1_i1.p1 TRINITY_DN1226_c0_g1~~TRINITY_DN1226_c0_g1_i1.p1  ORF type:complete len:572 (-),score=198.31 TRINITY_DN1226_c0_g1_i1:101-1816(-)